MRSVKAKVQNGRLVVDEPTTLPDGTVIELVPADAIEDDGLDDEERARLHDALDQAWQEVQAGQGIPAEQVIDELRSM